MAANKNTAYRQMKHFYNLCQSEFSGYAVTSSCTMCSVTKCRPQGGSCGESKLHIGKLITLHVDIFCKMIACSLKSYLNFMFSHKLTYSK